MSNKNRQEGEGNLKLITGLAGSWNSFHVSQPKTWQLHVALQLYWLDGRTFLISQTSLQWVTGHGRIDQAFRQREWDTLGLCFVLTTSQQFAEIKMARPFDHFDHSTTEKFEAQGESWLHLVGTLMSQHFRWNLGKKTRSNQHHTGSTACCRGRSCFLVDCKLKTQWERGQKQPVNQLKTHLKAHRTVKMYSNYLTWNRLIMF